MNQLGTVWVLDFYKSTTVGEWLSVEDKELLEILASKTLLH